MEGIIKKNEVDLLVMEEENVSLAKNYEDRQLQWEQREVELERIIAQMEKQQAEIAGAASQVITSKLLLYTMLILWQLK